jgi:O-methyltransferase involved in polyketide biosynthesis
MHKDKKVNIVSLGCGYDSTYFWLKKTVDNASCIESYVELDFADVVTKKSEFILKNEEMSSFLENTNHVTQKGNESLTSDIYKLFYADVRDREIIKEKLSSLKVDGSLPTLVLTECLLIYMKGADSQCVLEWVSDYFNGDLSFVNYEMINPNDKFGEMMVGNLENRGCQLLGIHECPSIERQKQRM